MKLIVVNWSNLVISGAILLLPAWSAGQTFVGWGFDHSSILSGIPAGGDFVQVSSGGQSTEPCAVALRSDGRLTAWGNDVHGQVSGTPTGDGFAAVDVGASHVLALRSDGSLVSWGESYGSMVIEETPLGSDFVAIGSGFDFSVALRANGTLVTWGFWWELPYPEPTDVVAFAVGDYHGVALRSDGSLVSWGWDQFGTVSNTPPGNDFVAVAAGTNQSIALRSNGTIVSWGRDFAFGLISNTPSEGGFTALGAGYITSAAIRSDGTVAVWGGGYAGTFAPPPGGGFIALCGGTRHFLALRSVPLDADGDSLTDEEEVTIYGTDPNNPDSDSDGLMDGTEVEMAQGSGCPNPLVPDSDGDGLTDGAEVSLGTSPCNPDTDNDGLNDGLDPTPLTPGVPGSWIESSLRVLAGDILDMNLAVFDAPNPNAGKGRRNAMSSRLTSAANLFALGDTAGAIVELQSLMEKLDGNSSPPDWLLDPDRDALYDYIELLIILM